MLGNGRRLTVAMVDSPEPFGGGDAKPMAAPTSLSRDKRCNAGKQNFMR